MDSTTISADVARQIIAVWNLYVDLSAAMAAKIHSDMSIQELR